MESLEQTPHEEPSFMWVVILFAATFLIILFVSFIAMRYDGAQMVPVTHDPPLSKLVSPAITPAIATTIVQA